MFGQNPDLKTWAIKMEISEKLNMGNRLKSLSEHVVTLASCPMLWHKLNQPNENCWMKNTWCYKDLLILLYFCNFRRPWSTKIVQEEIEWIGVVIFSLFPGVFYVLSAPLWNRASWSFVCVFWGGFCVLGWGAVCVWHFPLNVQFTSDSYWCGATGVPPSCGWKALCNIGLNCLVKFGISS